MTDTAAAHEQVSTRRAATRARLAEAAVRVFARKGVEGASVEEICDEAGFTRGAFYSNFESRNELCIDVIQRFMDRTFDALAAQLPKVSQTRLPIQDKLELAVEMVGRTADNDPDEILAISEIRLQAARDPELRPAYQALNDSAAPTVRQLVADVMAANHVNLGVSVDDLLRIMRTLYDQQMIEALISGAPDPSRTVSEQMVTLLKALMRG